jgi:hypothetical protein
MDTFWSCGFGVETDFQNDPNHPYFIKTLKALNNILPLNNIYKSIVYLDEFRPYVLTAVFLYTMLMTQIGLGNLTDPIFWLNQNIYEVIEKRSKTNVILFILNLEYFAKTAFFFI